MKHFTPKLLLLLCTLLALKATAQPVVDGYVAEALQNNLVLKEKNISLQKSMFALKEARSLYQPTTWLDAQYILSQGGRTIDLPVGDLLNPVYRTLNQLTSSEKFPSISNVKEQLNPNNFYDVRVKTTMPIVNSSLRYNQAIKQQETSLQQNEIDMYKRELVKEVKNAYFNYIAAGNAIAIYQNALQVVNQNLRVNQSLIANGKGLPAYVARAESEVKQVESQLQNAVSQQENAKAYFNFLLNKPLSDTIAIAEVLLPSDLLAQLANENIAQREELKGLSIAKEINLNALKMNQSFRTPKLNAFVDLAAQGFDLKVNRQSFFYLGGVQLQVPIFTGHRNEYKIDQSRMDVQALDVRTAQVNQQLQLAAQVSRNNIIAGYSTYLSSLKQQEAAQKYFRLIDRGFKEGINSFIEFLDARNQETSAQLQVNINKYKLLAALADYERQTATYAIN